MYCDPKTSNYDLDKIDKQHKHEKLIAEKFNDPTKRKIVEMSLAGHPPREILKVVDVCRQYVDKIKQEYKKALAEMA